VLLPLLKDRKIGRVVDRRSLKNLLGLLMRNFYINPNAFLLPVSCHLTTVQVHTRQVMQCSRLPLEIIMQMIINAAQYDAISSRVSVTDDIGMSFLSVCPTLLLSRSNCTCSQTLVCGAQSALHSYKKTPSFGCLI